MLITGGQNYNVYREPAFEEEACAFFRSRLKLEAPDLSSGGRLLLTADHHFYHGNILKRCPERGRLIQATSPALRIFFPFRAATSAATFTNRGEDWGPL